MKSLSKLEDNSIHRQYITLFLCLFSPCVTSGNWQKTLNDNNLPKKKKITNNSTTGLKGIILPLSWKKNAEHWAQDTWKKYWIAIYAE